MKKVMLLVVLSFVLFLSACVSIDRIGDNFVDEGYTKSENASDFIGDVLTSVSRKDFTVTSHVYREGTKTAVILVFESSDDLQTELEENETLQGFIADLEEDRLVRGNILLIPIALSNDDLEEIIDIFNQ